MRTSFLYILLLPYGLYYTGATLNQVVIVANHGEFPVMINPVKLHDFIGDDDDTLAQVQATGMIDDVHCIMTSKTHLNYLSDIFELRHDGIYSVGDFMLMAGESLEFPTFFAWLALIIYKEHQKYVD